MAHHGALHVLDSTSGKARPVKMTNEKLNVADSAVATALGGTLTVADSSVVSALSATLSVSDSAVASALGGTLTVTDSAVASALGGTLTTTSAVTKTQTSIASAQSVTSGGFSTSSHNCSNERSVVVVGTTSDLSNNIDIYISFDNSTYYKHGHHTIFPDSNGNFSVYLEAPFKYVKLGFNGSGTVSAVVFGSN